MSEVIGEEENGSTICVYCSSSDAIDEQYFPAARALGRTLAARGFQLIYGGGTAGLMGALAQAVRDGGGYVCGVIPERLQKREGVARDTADELIVTETMQQRKATMYRRADAFAALPGGFGTLEEFMEVLTLKQLGYHGKPLALINTGGFYDALIAFFEQLYDGRFARPTDGSLYHLASGPDEAMDHLAAHLAPQSA